MKTSLITISTDINADPLKVWSRYTQPEHIVNWNFASDDWHCPSAESDLRVGGRYSARMEAKDGSFGFDLSAVYDEIIDGEKIVYTLEDGRKVTTEFKVNGDMLTVSTTFEAENENSLEMQRDGWQAILDNFKKYAESE